MLTIVSAYWPDTKERQANFDSFIEFWNYQDETTYIIGDMDEDKSRSEALNMATSMVYTPYMAIVDLDVEIPIQQVHQALELLEYGADMVYPYDRIIDKDGIKYTAWPKRYKYGCACFFNTDKYIDAGGENENFRGWGYDDFERHYRMLNHGLTEARIPGHIFHKHHPRAEFTTEDIRHNARLYEAERKRWIDSQNTT